MTFAYFYNPINDMLHLSIENLWVIVYYLYTTNIKKLCLIYSSKVLKIIK